MVYMTATATGLLNCWREAYRLNADIELSMEDIFTYVSSETGWILSYYKQPNHVEGTEMRIKKMLKCSSKNRDTCTL